MGYANDFLEKAIAEYAEKSAEEISRLFFDAAQVSDEFYRVLTVRRIAVP